MRTIAFAGIGWFVGLMFAVLIVVTIPWGGTSTFSLVLAALIGFVLSQAGLWTGVGVALR